MIQDAISLCNATRVEILRQVSAHRSLAWEIDRLFHQPSPPTYGLERTFQEVYKIGAAQAKELVQLLDLYFDSVELVNELRKK